MRKMEFHQQGPPAKEVKLDEVLAANCRADLVTECMKRKKTLILSADFHFRFSAENKCPFSFSAINGISFSAAFSFMAEYEKCFSVGLLYSSQKGLGLGLEH